MLERMKNYFVTNFEAAFVLMVLLIIALINYYIPYKIAFLGFYYIPVLLSAFYLGLRKALYGAILCIFLVVIFAYMKPDTYFVGGTSFDLFFNISAWACFLLLTGIILGTIKEKLTKEYETTSKLNEELKEKEGKLEKANEELKGYGENLERKVKQRTEDLEKSKMVVENLKQKVEDTLFSTMDPTVARLVIEERLRNEKREISVLFSDLKGFTSYSEMRQPEIVIGDLNEYLQDMESIILSYHGHIDKYMGVGIMAEFGAPINYETHAILAVLAGIKMQEKLISGNFPWEMRIGIATGDAITGLIGSKRQNYTAIGDVVNVASRLEAECRSGIVTIDEDTYKMVAEFITAKRKLYLGEDQFLYEKHRKQIGELNKKLQTDPDDFEANKRLGLIYKEIGVLPIAIEHIKKALDLKPGDDELKLVFAETTIELERQGNIAIRGKNKTLHLFEVTGLKDPLKNSDKIPQELYDRYSEEVNKLVEYPSKIILPIEAFDGSIGHSKVVGFLSYALADSMGVPEKEKKDILLAGYLCDIGKEIIPHHILNRRGRLIGHEFDEVLKHCDESVRILRKLGYENEHTFDIIAAHHENFDGSGYPKGLSGTDIPLGARIVGIADKYDALTSWRSYREKWDYRAAYSEIEKGKHMGKTDPDVVNHLGELIKLRAA